MIIALIVEALILWGASIGYFFIWKPVQFRRRRRAQNEYYEALFERLGRLD